MKNFFFFQDPIQGYDECGPQGVTVEKDMHTLQ